MSVEIKVPSAGESVTSGLLAAWLKEDGATVAEGEELFEFETDKATIAVPAPAAGVLKQLAAAGTDVEVGRVVGEIVTTAGAAGTSAAGAPTAAKEGGVRPAAAGSSGNGKSAPRAEGVRGAGGEPVLSPAVRRVVEENRLDPGTIRGTGKAGRITKEDALAAVETARTGGGPTGEAPDRGAAPPQEAAGLPSSISGRAPASEPPAGVARAGAQAAARSARAAGERQSRVPMTTIRKRIAENLVRAKQQAAHLTTFNEIDMSAVMELRSRYKDTFEQRHGVRLGFMSFFVKASVEALSELPAVNAQVDGESILYNNYYDIGVAVASERGLVVPVIRDADALSFAEIERSIADLAARARNKRLTVDDLSGGTFTITNGGVYGSLLSTPILNPPQSAILGMQKRPVVVNDAIVIRPMMYVALTYDHRIVDGQGAVSFLVRIKQLIEDPERLLLEV